MGEKKLAQYTISYKRLNGTDEESLARCEFAANMAIAWVSPLEP